MHRRHLLLVLPLFALLLLTARLASAAPPDAQNAAFRAPAGTEARRPIDNEPMAEAMAVVERRLVKPLAAKEAGRSRFTRGSIPPQARRVRVLDPARSTDGRGAEFVAFAVDEHSRVFAALAADDAVGWRKNAIVGCVYPARDEIFIKRVDKFFGVGLLLGQKTAPADDSVCRPASAPIHPSPPTQAGLRKPETDVTRKRT